MVLVKVRLKEVFRYLALSVPGIALIAIATVCMPSIAAAVTPYGVTCSASLAARAETHCLGQCTNRAGACFESLLRPGSGRLLQLAGCQAKGWTCSRNSDCCSGDCRWDSTLPTPSGVCQ